MATIRRVGSVPPDRSGPRIPARGAAYHWYYSADDAPGRSERERGETRRRRSGGWFRNESVVPGSEKPAVTLNESILSRAVRGENLVPCLLREVASVAVVANFALGHVVLDQATGRTRGPTGLGGRDEVHVVVVGTAGEPVTIVVEEHSEVGRVVAGAVKANRLGQLRDVAQRLGRDARDCPGDHYRDPAERARSRWPPRRAVRGRRSAGAGCPPRRGCRRRSCSAGRQRRGRGLLEQLRRLRAREQVVDGCCVAGAARPFDLADVAVVGARLCGAVASAPSSICDHSIGVT
jgi:hypothetical protein